MVLSMYMVRFSSSIEQQKHFIIAKLTDLGVVWCSYNEPTNCLCVYRCLLTKCLHGRAADLCLANSWNNSVTTTKCMTQHTLLFLSQGIGKVLLCRHNQKLFTAYQHFDRHLLY